MESGQHKAAVNTRFDTHWQDWVAKHNKRGYVLGFLFVWISNPLYMLFEHSIAEPELASDFLTIRAIYLAATLPTLAVALSPKLFRRFNQAMIFIFLLMLQTLITFICVYTGGFDSPHFFDFTFTLLVTTILIVWPNRLVMATYPLLCAGFMAVMWVYSPPMTMVQLIQPAVTVILGGVFGIVMTMVRNQDAAERMRAFASLEEYKARAEANHSEIERMSEELRQMTVMDSLTMVANRRGFDLHLEEVWQEYKTSRVPASLIFCDVDLFKPYNDTYGHQKGDDCLKRVAGTLQASTYRSSDLVARYGGEEFAILLPGVDLDTAMRVAERMRVEVSKQSIPHTSSDVENVVTISLGVASTEQQPKNADELLRLADKALYRAKKRGRNCVALPSDNTLIDRL